MHVQSRPGGEGRERGRRGMAVVVALTDGNQSDAGSHRLKELFEASVGRAVMRDLQDFGLRRSQRQGDVRLRIGGEQRVDVAYRAWITIAALFGSSPGVTGCRGHSTRS
jgi:hypothetical protein